MMKPQGGSPPRISCNNRYGPDHKATKPGQLKSDVTSKLLQFAKIIMEKNKTRLQIVSKQKLYAE